MKVEWIPVSERLPDTMRDVWITTANGHVFADSYSAVFGVWKGDDIIIAWAEMELPEPYEPEAE